MRNMTLISILALSFALCAYAEPGAELVTITPDQMGALIQKGELPKAMELMKKMGVTTEELKALSSTMDPNMAASMFNAASLRAAGKTAIQSEAKTLVAQSGITGVASVPTARTETASSSAISSRYGAVVQSAKMEYSSRAEVGPFATATQKANAISAVTASLVQAGKLSAEVRNTVMADASKYTTEAALVLGPGTETKCAEMGGDANRELWTVADAGIQAAASARSIEKASVAEKAMEAQMAKDGLDNPKERICHLGGAPCNLLSAQIAAVACAN